MRADDLFIVGDDCFMRVKDLCLMIYTKMMTLVKLVKMFRLT